MEASEKRKRVSYENQRNNTDERATAASMVEKENPDRKRRISDDRSQRQSRLKEVEDWIVEQNMSKSVESILGQSTPMDRSLENDKAHTRTSLDVSRVEVAEELQKQHSERLQKLWKHQSEQNQKIFEKLDESMTRQERNSNLREHHARQMEDLRLYYEGEVSGLKKQLQDMKNAVFRYNKQEDTVKMEIQKQFETLSSTNVELSAKCDALESGKRSVENQLQQMTCQKQELESQCQQLVATNQIIDTRSHEIKRIKEETGAKLKDLERELKTLECKCDALTEENAILRNSKRELEMKYSQLHERSQKLTDKCNKLKEESKILGDRNKTQKSLIEKTNENVRELERVIETLKRELEDGKVKLEVDRSIYNATQQRLDRLVVQNRDKDLIIQNLEKQTKNLEATMKEVAASTAKAGLNEIKESIRKDKLLLKRVMKEYDSLNIKHDEAKGHVQRLENKLAESQSEGQNLRKELSELNITKKNLENSLRQVLGDPSSCRRIVERSTRRTWEKSENFNFFTGEPFRCDDDEKNSRERLQLQENLESTRRENNQFDEDELVDLSQIPSRENKDPVLPGVYHGCRSLQYSNLSRDGNLPCDFCEPASSTKDEEKRSYSFRNVGKKQNNLVTNHFRKQPPKGIKKTAWKESSPRSKGHSTNKVKEEIDYVDKQRQRSSLVSAENRFLELSEQRRRLEAALVRIPSSRMSRQEREDKKFLENQLDQILKEIGKIRLQLKMQEVV